MAYGRLAWVVNTLRRPRGPGKLSPADPWGLGPRIDAISERWYWLASGVALALAAAVGLDAFGITVGVLAAAQATLGGERIERAAARIETTTRAIQAEGRHGRISRVEAVLNNIDGALMVRTITGDEADDLGRQLYQAARFSGEVDAQVFSATAKLIDALLDYEGHPTRQGTAYDLRNIKATFPAAEREWEKIRAEVLPRWQARFPRV